jgi:hypothetical protein
MESVISGGLKNKLPTEYTERKLHLPHASILLSRDHDLD